MLTTTKRKHVNTVSLER